MNRQAPLKNLDWLAASCAQNLINKILTLNSDKKATLKTKANAADNMVTKTLGVLQENGIYASALFLKSRKGDEQPLADTVMKVIFTLLEELSDNFGFNWGKPPDVNDVEKSLDYLGGIISEDLERILLAKETLEQMLVYARYSAKARSAEKEAEVVQ